MKYLILLLFIVSASLFSQEGEIVYGINLNLTIEKINERVKKSKRKLNQEVITTLKKMVLNSREIEGVLLFSNMISNYEINESVKNEGVKGVSFIKNDAGGNNFYHTSLLLQKNKQENCEILEACYVVENEKPIWELTQETKYIGGYLCYKAIQSNSKNKIKKPIAWYTNEIPLGYGPVEFYGLPGLILELEKSTITFKAKKIVFNSKNKIKIRELKGKEVTKKEFKSLLIKAFPDFYNYKK
ncbi:GLPGLI family protein [Tenacibaculum sp. MAR_2010_89]|uniref:GLPGLI family protein n=1 Tax=Tenacibaculum sp. MAR_2010_89 TaxID=1250198 RepID=UPI00089D4A6F|nr:GLPGLI family protein [Tenacibaculum sp. MAR_2010_89]SEE06557.1 GLPGLI family protein [Tenacibaculum sp. MAR_2010_89]